MAVPTWAMPAGLDGNPEPVSSPTRDAVLSAVARHVAAAAVTAERTIVAIEVRVRVNGPAVLIFDGLFLHRPELAPFWDHSVLLVADARLGADWLVLLMSGLPPEPSARAAMIDNTAVGEPEIVASMR